jgi:hypothetical protein
MNYLIAAAAFAAIPMLIFISVYFGSKFMDWTHRIPEHIGVALYMSVFWPGALALTALIIFLLVFGMTAISAG